MILFYQGRSTLDAVFKTSPEFWQFLSEHIIMERPKMLYISTYNIWTAISNWPHSGLPTRMNPVQKVMTYMNNISIDSKIMAGVFNDAFEREYDRIIDTWPNVPIKLSDNHAKMIFTDKQCWVGSTNFNDGSHKTLNIMINCDDNYSELLLVFNKYYNVASDI